MALWYVTDHRHGIGMRWFISFSARRALRLRGNCVIQPKQNEENSKEKMFPVKSDALKAQVMEVMAVPFLECDLGFDEGRAPTL